MGKGKSKPNSAKVATMAMAAQSEHSDKPDLTVLTAVYVGIFILVLLSYTYTMTSQFVFNDPANFRALLATKEASEFYLQLIVNQMSQPLSQLWTKATYARDLETLGGNAGWSHAVNICMHLLTCLYMLLFVFRVSWQLLKEGRLKLNPYFIAAAATALFACHPLTSGSIAYISGRSGVLAGCNYFLALNCCLYALLEEKLMRAFVGYGLYYAFTAIGFCANVQCFSIPFVALALTLILKPADLKWKEWISDRWYEMFLVLLPAFAFCAMFYVWPIPVQVDNGFGAKTLPRMLYLASQFKVLITYYLRCTFLPFGLAISPPNVISSGFADPFTIAGSVVLAAGTVVGLIQKQPIIKVGTLIFVLTLLPWFIYAQPEVVADSRFYLPLSGLAIIFGVAVASLAGTRARSTAVVLAAILAIFVALTIYRSVEWSAEKHLWRAEIKLNPNDARTQALWANFLLRERKAEEAKKHIDIALKLDPNDFQALAQLGYYQMEQGDFYQGAVAYKKAINEGKARRLDPEQLAIYHEQLAQIYDKMGDLKHANEEGELAFQFIKKDPALFLILGKAKIKQHQPLQALHLLQEGHELDRSYPFFLEPIAQASLDSGIPQIMHQAYVASKRANLITHSSEAKLLFIRSCLELGKVEEAKPWLQSMQTNQPHDPEVLLLTYAYYKVLGQDEVAQTWRQKAIAQEPDIEKRIPLFLKMKPGASEPEPDIKVKGIGMPKPDLSKISPIAPGIVPPDSIKSPAPPHQDSAKPLAAGPNKP